MNAVTRRRIEAVVRTALAIGFWTLAIQNDGPVRYLFGVLAAGFTLGAAAGWWLSWRVEPEKEA
jgi:hypothetical protein